MNHSYHLHIKLFCCHFIILDLAKTMCSSFQVDVPYENIAALNSKAVSNLNTVCCQCSFKYDGGDLADFK